MTHKELKNKIKQELKTLASEIRVGKFLRKPKNWDNASEEDRKRGRNQEWKSWTFRHKHIAYCMFFNGTPYDKIENKTHVPPSNHKIEGYKKEWSEKIDEESEALRVSA